MTSPRKIASLYENVIRQFNKAADLIGLDQNIRQILATTENELIFHLPVKIDNGQIKMFTGYWV